MFGISESINTLNAVSVNDIGHLDTLVKTIRHGMYEDNIAQTIVSSINKQLSVGHTRDKGFELLHNILPDCSTKVLRENCLTWTNYALSHHPKEPIPGRRLQVLCTILDLCHAYQDYHKAIVTNILPKIMETCLSVHRKSKEAWFSLDCLIKCLQYFSTTCIVYKKKIEGYLITIMDTSVAHSIVEQAGACMHYLNQAGGSGSLGSTHIKNYMDHFSKLCNTLDVLYNTLFENTNEYCEHNGDYTNVYEFKEIPANLGETDKLRILERRLRNTTIFILKSMECNYPVKKSIKPEILLSVIERGLAVHVHINENNINNILLSSVIQNHQIELLNLLKTCITCLKENFIRFSTIKIVLDYLSRTQNCNCFKSLSEYKIVIYQILEYWVLNSSEFLDSGMYDRIIKHIISDISPVKHSLILQDKNIKQKNALEKQIDNILPLRLQQTTEDICYQALVTLHVLLQKVLLTIKDNTCSILFETIIKNLFDISVNIHNNPYTHKHNRLMLYKALIAIFDQQRKSLDISLAINILNIGQLSFDVEISNICSVGLASLEKICQPTHLALSLNILDDIDDQHNNKPQKRDLKRVSTLIAEDEPMETDVVNNADLKINQEVINDNSTEEISVNRNGNNEEKSIDTQDKTAEISSESKSNSDNISQNDVTKDNSPIEVVDLDDTNNEIIDLDKAESESNIITLDEGEESVEEIDLQLEESSVPAENIVEKDEVPTKKQKLNDSEDEIDVVGEDVEDMLSSFVDEVNE